VKAVKDFTKLDLKKIDAKFKSANDLKLNTMDKNNFLWVLFQNDDIKDLSRVTEIKVEPKVVPNSQKISSAKQHPNNKPNSNNNIGQGVIQINNIDKNNLNNKNPPNVHANKNNYIDQKDNSDDRELEKALKESQAQFEMEKKRNMEEVKVKELPNKVVDNSYETPKGEDNFLVKNVSGNANNNFFELKDFVDLSIIESKTRF
jgi:hypothetical protein